MNLENRQKNFTIITAGGIGSRMKSDIPKQFIPVNNLPVLMHTINTFYRFDKNLEIILSLPSAHIEYWEMLKQKYNFNIHHTIVAGGATRFESVKNALQQTHGQGYTAIHDGVRPLVSCETIKEAFRCAAQFGNAVAAVDIVFSIRKIENNENYSVDRSNFCEIQTPQIFRTQDIKEAYNQEYSELFTDDSSVMEAYGKKIYLSKGNAENIKITRKLDITIVEALLRKK